MSLIRIQLIEDYYNMTTTNEPGLGDEPRLMENRRLVIDELVEV
jgi:hypothetical protein